MITQVSPIRGYLNSIEGDINLPSHNTPCWQYIAFNGLLCEEILCAGVELRVFQRK